MLSAPRPKLHSGKLKRIPPSVDRREKSGAMQAGVETGLTRHLDVQLPLSAKRSPITQNPLRITLDTPDTSLDPKKILEPLLLASKPEPHPEAHRREQQGCVQRRAIDDRPADKEQLLGILSGKLYLREEKSQPGKSFPGADLKTGQGRKSKTATGPVPSRRNSYRRITKGARSWGGRSSGFNKGGVCAGWQS